MEGCSWSTGLLIHAREKIAALQHHSLIHMQEEHEELSSSWELQDPLLLQPETDKARQGLRGSCTQQWATAERGLSILHLAEQLPAAQNSPGCWGGDPEPGSSWRQSPDSHRIVCLMRISCQRRGRVGVADYSRQPKRIQAVAGSWICPQMTQVSPVRCWVGAGCHCRMWEVTSTDRVKLTPKSQ